MIQERKYDRVIERFENIGNSVTFYLLLLILLMGLWILTPFGPDWRPNGATFGILGIVLVVLSSVHGALWWLITRQYLHLPKKVRATIATAIRFLRPLHMMTGMLALGIVLIHGYSFLKIGYGWNQLSITGLISLVVLLILAIDGIGLMASPLLSRIVHRWVAAGFLIVLAVHLWFVW